MNFGRQNPYECEYGVVVFTPASGHNECRRLRSSPLRLLSGVCDVVFQARAARSVDVRALPRRCSGVHALISPKPTCTAKSTASSQPPRCQHASHRPQHRSARGHCTARHRAYAGASIVRGHRAWAGQVVCSYATVEPFQDQPYFLWCERHSYDAPSDTSRILASHATNTRSEPLFVELRGVL